MYVSAGGELKYDHQVMEILPGDEVTVRTNGGSFMTKRLIITTGPWTNKILRPLGVELQAKVGSVIKNNSLMKLICLVVFIVCPPF